MNIQQMLYFRSIAKNESITKAAEEFYIAPSAMSRLLRQLENELNSALFDRTGRTITLNPNGDKLLSHIEIILDEYTEIENYFHPDANSDTKKIKLCGLDGYILSSIVQRYQQKHPTATIENIPVSYTRAMDLLLEGRVDLVFSDDKNIDRLRVMGRGNYETLFLVKNKLFLSVPKNSPLSEKESISLKEIEKERFICSTDAKNIHFTEFLDTICARAKVKLNFVHDYDYDKYIKVKTESPYLSFGDTLHISYYNTTHRRRDFLRISDEGAHQHLYFCYKKNATISAELIEAIKSEFLEIFK